MTHQRRSAYIPAGTDHQGRRPRTGCFVQAAEAANDLCAEPDRDAEFRRSACSALVRYLLACAAAVGVTALVIFGGPR